VFNEGELDEKSNVQKMHIAFSDKPVTLYSLDVIISVGYRVKSQQGTQFRQWATQKLKEYLVKGYNIFWGASCQLSFFPKRAYFSEKFE
jgi:hypothetical protein